MDENDLQALGDAALGFNTFYHYSGAHDFDLNRKMTAKIQEANKTSVTNLSTVGAYDGTHIIYEMVKAGNGDVKKGFEAVKIWPGKVRAVRSRWTQNSAALSRMSICAVSNATPRAVS